MKVHFTASRDSLINNIESLRCVLAIIRDRDHAIVQDWIEDAYTQMEQERSKKEMSQLFHQSVEDVTKADVMIAEVTHSSFGVGYQVAIAMQQKKPVLLLTKRGAKNVSLVNGLDDTLVKLKEYDVADLAQLIGEFLSDNNIQPKDLRFNFFIDRQIYNYLRWVSVKTGKPKAEILREFISKEIDKDNQT